MSARRLRFFPLALAAAAALSGCADERAPINRVQPNALDKTFFVGASLADARDNPEFYYRPTVVDADYGASQNGLFTASYAQTLARIGWEITEELLVARLTYERVDDTTGLGAPDDNSGQIVAAFRIDSHFDIRRAYNPQTGEDLNIVEENTDDRAWYERGFMRVDWSQNLVTSAYELDTLAALKAFADNPIEYESAAYSVEDPSSEDAPRFVAEDGYFDITTKVFAKPQLIETPFGTFPACFFNTDFFGGSGPGSNCNPVELKIRLSFRQVTDTDYEPVDWTGQRQAMFGAFTTGTLTPVRLGYDRNYGIVDSKWRRFANRHNIWQQSHARGEDGERVACNEDGDCADVASGSRCDVYVEACTVPYREREIRPIVYYYGPDSDPSLFDAVASVGADWDSALRHAVQTARYAECVRTGGGVESETAVAACRSEYPTSLEDAERAVGPVLVVCHNPVAEGDPEACGEPGLVARVGDLRYHIANIIQAPQTPSPWGILADATDPISGEVVASSVNVWNHVTDLQTQRTVDTMRWYLGELSSDDVIQGNYVKDYNVLAPIPNGRPPARGPSLLSRAEVDARLGAMDRSLVDPAAVPSLPAMSGRQLVDWATATTRERFGGTALGGGNAMIASRLLAARGTPVETELVTAPYLSLAGLDHGSALEGMTLDAASPLRGAFFQNRAALERQRHVHLAGAGRCVLEASEPTSVVELADKLLAKFPGEDLEPRTVEIELSADGLRQRNQKWTDYVRKRLTHGVMAHEMGHSMGLRHVFTSSFDALNYHPQYWQLRTRDKQETAYCAEPTTDGASCVGPRWNDPLTDTERDGMLMTWQQTSVMDYAGDMTQDLIGIGAYDRAAIRFIYGDVTEVVDDPRARCGVDPLGGTNCTRSVAGELLAAELDSFGGIQGSYYGLSAGQPMHYSRLDQALDLIRDCRPADTAPPADWNEEENGIYDPVLDGHIVNGTVCSGLPTDYVGFSDLVGVVTDFDGPVRKVDALGRVRRPYMFASDEYADIGNIAVYRNDNGADAYEVASFFINEYEDRHVFDNHRRGRTSFTLSGAFGRSYGRYHEKLKELTKAYALLNEIFGGSDVLDFVLQGEIGDALSKPHALAASLTFDHITRMLTRPTSGDHFASQPDAAGNVILRSTDQAIVANSPTERQRRALVVPEGTQTPGSSPSFGGRPLHNALDGTKGYYATDYDLWVGSYYEKTQAIDLLADSTDRFISQSRDDFADGRYRNVSLATLFPEGVRRLISTALTEDSSLLGWQVASSGGAPRVASSTLLPTQPLGFRVWWPADGPRTCWPAPGQLGCMDYTTGMESGLAPPAESMTIDPELGFEVQKFVVFFSLLYLPDSWKRDWVDLLRVYQEGADPNPAFPVEESVAFRDPVSGERYLAHSHGKETMDGKVVDRGVGSRALEWANTLAARAYSVASTDPVTGELTFERYLDDSACPPGTTSCAGQPVIADRTYATRLASYRSVIDFMRQATAELGFYGPGWRGVYR